MGILSDVARHMTSFHSVNSLQKYALLIHATDEDVEVQEGKCVANAQQSQIIIQFCFVFLALKKPLFCFVLCACVWLGKFGVRQVTVLFFFFPFKKRGQGMRREVWATSSPVYSPLCRRTSL